MSMAGRYFDVILASERYRELSLEACCLYAFMLGRRGERGHQDPEGREFIIYPIEDIMADLRCRKGKVASLRGELRESGLIEEVRQGKRFPNRIYFRESVEPADGSRKTDIPEEAAPGPAPEPDGKRSAEDGGGFSEASPEGAGTETGSPENDRHKTALSAGDGRKPADNNLNNINNNKINDRIDCDYDEMSESLSYSQSIYNTASGKRQPDTGGPPPRRQGASGPPTGGPAGPDAAGAAGILSAQAGYRERIRKNIQYDHLCATDDKEAIDEIVNLMTDVMMMPDRGMIRIRSQPTPVSLVKSHLMVLEMDHIEYVRECLKKCNSYIYRMRAYLLTCLFNAPLTISHFYNAWARHDMAYGFPS